MSSPPPFEQIFLDHRDRIYRYCLLRVRNVAEAEDLAAEVFLAAYQAYERAAPPPDRVQFWLLRIAANRIANWRRHLAVVQRVLPWLSAEPVAGPEAEVILNDDMRRVLEGMGHLRNRDRQLISLRLGAGLSHGEIAAMLGMREPAVVMATKRALERLRQELGEFRWTPS